MLNKLLLLLLLLQTSITYSQDSWEEFTGKEKAFFYQLSRKIENTNPEVFHLFEFTDSIPYINDTLPDYPYIEKQIIADSSRLILHTSQLSRKNTGILSDIATHYATWELSLLLNFKDSQKPKYQYLKPKFKQFETYVAEKAPQAAIKQLSNGEYGINPALHSYFSPNLSISEKIAAVKNAKLGASQKFAIIRAIHHGQEKYIKVRVKEIIKLLTGQTLNSENFMLAAGNGSNWEELESVLRTKYNRTVPDPKSLFKYELDTETDPKTKREKIVTKDVPVLKMQTQKGLSTKLHIDVWAYHPKRQTTIVIQKGGNSYILYGKNEHRYVSPDSTFEEGVTYRNLLYELEHVLIADLKEKIYGKRGFDYLIALYEKKTEATRLQIKKTEIKLDEIRYTPAGAPKMKKKKKKSKKSSGYSYQDTKDTPQGKLTKNAKKRNIEQARLVAYNGQLESQLLMLKQLKIEKELAFDLLAQYEGQLDMMKKNVGYNVLEYTTDKKGNYLFNDGTTFNYKTQDLTFAPDFDSHYFEVILISFGEHVLDKKREEVFVHFNKSYNDTKDKYTLYSERSTINRTKKYTIADSIQIQEFFNALTQKKMKTIVRLNSLGMASGQSPYYYSDSTTTPVKEEEQLKNKLTYTTIIQVSNNIELDFINASNHIIPKIPDTAYDKFKSKYPGFSMIDYYTYTQNELYFKSWKNEMTSLAEIWLKDSPDQNTVLKKIKKLKPGSRKLKGQKI